MECGRAGLDAMRLAILMPLTVTWSRDVAIGLAGLGHEVHAIDFEGQVEGNYLRDREDIHSPAISRLRRAIAGIHTIPGKNISQMRYALYAPRLAKAFRQTKADILLTLWGGGFAAIAYLSGIRPYAVFVGGGDILRVSGLQKIASRKALSKASVVLANGDFFARRTQEFAPGASVVPLYYGIDPSKFIPGNPPSSPVVVLCTRGFSRPYNNGYLIQALATMPPKVPEFRVVFASAGETLEETKRLADSSLTPEMRRRVEFLNGVTDDVMLENLRRAHVYTSASLYDGTSISLLEGLSCGLFPVLSDIPANREWIYDGGCAGSLFSLSEPASYGRALLQAIEDAELRSRAAVLNRQAILDRADSRKTIATLASILNGVRS